MLMASDHYVSGRFRLEETKHITLKSHLDKPPTPHWNCSKSFIAVLQQESNSTNDGRRQAGFPYEIHLRANHCRQT